MFYFHPIRSKEPLIFNFPTLDSAKYFYKMAATAGPIVSQLSKCLKFMTLQEGCFVIRNWMQVLKWRYWDFLSPLILQKMEEDNISQLGDDDAIFCEQQYMHGSCYISLFKTESCEPTLTSAVKHRHPVYLLTFLHCSKTRMFVIYHNFTKRFSKWFHSFLLKLCSEAGKLSYVTTREKKIHIVLSFYCNVSMSK